MLSPYTLPTRHGPKTSYVFETVEQAQHVHHLADPYLSRFGVCCVDGRYVHMHWQSDVSPKVLIHVDAVMRISDVTALTESFETLAKRRGGDNG